MDEYLKKLHFDFRTNQKILNKIAEIEKFQGKWDVLEIKDSDFLRELKQIATIQSIGSSTRIEGSKLSDAEIKTLLSDLEVNKLENCDEQEVIGYWETLELILENSSELILSENIILQLHSILLKYSDKDSRQRGKYKNQSNKVVATFPDGVEKVIFNTTEPHLVMKEMNELVNWVNSQFEEKSLNLLLIIGIFIYEFLSIHPFHDGNGRLSRLLTTFLLLKNNYYFVQYVSFEYEIEAHKKEYYNALMECQKHRGTELEIIGLWIEFFLQCILNLSEKLENKLTRIVQKDQYLNSRQKQIISILRIQSPSKISDILNEMENVSIHSLKKDLAFLVEHGIISKQGANKGTTYYISNS